MLEESNIELGDKEFFEAVLRRVLPRRNIRPAADALLTQYGSFVRAATAPPDELHAIVHLGRAGVVALKTVLAAATRLLRGRVIGRSVVEFRSALMDYLTVAMAYEPKEHLRLLALDHHYCLLDDQVIFHGTNGYTQVYMRDLIEKAIRMRASAIIVAHNHPAGDPMPSEEDCDTTMDMEAAVGVMGIILFDHLIIGSEGCYSFRESGLLRS